MTLSEFLAACTEQDRAEAVSLLDQLAASATTDDDDGQRAASAAFGRLIARVEQQRSQS